MCHIGSTVSDYGVPKMNNALTHTVVNTWPGKVNTYPALNKAPQHKDVWGSECMDPHFPNLGSTRRRVVSFTLRPLYPRRKGPPPEIRMRIQKFPDWVDKEICMLTFGITRWEATESVMAEKFTRLTHKIAIQLPLVAKSITGCISRYTRPVWKFLDTPSYMYIGFEILIPDQYRSQ
jgi:hypothetical protein